MDKEEFKELTKKEIEKLEHIIKEIENIIYYDRSPIQFSFSSIEISIERIQDELKRIDLFSKVYFIRIKRIAEFENDEEFKKLWNKAVQEGERVAKTNSKWNEKIPKPYELMEIKDKIYSWDE